MLKKAVVEEQQKHEVVKSTITTQDQSIRKLEQELDSVKFRNRQLEKRIEILQEPDSPRSQPVSIDSNVLVHVEQNKQLQESLAQLSEKYSTEVGRLKRMIDHEMVPRDLLDSIKIENSERVQLLNKRVQEFSVLNGELRERVEAFEMEKAEAKAASSGSGEVSSEVAGLNELMGKLTDSEVAREKLNSEVQILRYRLKRLSVTEDTGSNITSPVDEKVSMLGRLQVIGDDHDKEIVIGFLTERNNELVRLLQTADSKAVYYYYEALNLCRLVRTTQLSYKRLDCEFGKLKVKYRGLGDEIEDLKRGYNGQVDGLTEHIALLNEKLVGLMDRGK